MALLRKISFAGHESDVQNFIAGDNVTFATQSDGSIKINATGGGGGGCVTYSLAWADDGNGLVLRNSDSVVVQTLPIMKLRIASGTEYVEIDTENVAVSMSAGMKAAFNAALA